MVRPLWALRGSDMRLRQILVSPLNYSVESKSSRGGAEVTVAAFTVVSLAGHDLADCDPGRGGAVGGGRVQRALQRQGYALERGVRGDDDQGEENWEEQGEQSSGGGSRDE
jgi:hypothetical protein